MYRFLGVILLGLLAVGQAGAQTRQLSSTGVLLDRIVAIVNEDVVLKSELDSRYQAVVDQLRAQQVRLPPRSTLQRQILEQLIMNTIQLQRAERLDMQVPDEMLNATLQTIAEKNGITFRDLPQALASQGIDYAQYREDIREEIMIDQLRQIEVVRRVMISPREVDQYLEKKSGGPQQTTEFNISHILISVPIASTPGQLDRAEQKAQSLYERASSGEDFGELALANSDAQDALDGGELGWRTAAQVPSVFADFVLTAGEGDVSPPIRSNSGFHLVKVNAIGGEESDSSMVEQYRAQHIMLQTNEIMDDEAVVQKLLQIRESIEDGEEDFAEMARGVSEDAASAKSGGDLGWTPVGYFDPVFESIVLELEPGVISEPFETQYGWHIAVLIERRVEDLSEEKKFEIAYREIMNRKAEEETELWLRRLRDEAFVEYRL